MKKTTTLLLTLLLLSANTFAGITTYTFTNAQWTSKQGTTACDGKTDGWISDKDGNDYSSAYQIGVKVTAKGTGAGATSVRSFTGVRRLTFNYATTTRGQGSIRVQIGGNAPIDTAFSISNPKNSDLTIVLPTEQTGKIRFQINCTRNSIYLNSVSVRSAEGVSPEFTQSTFRLVTDIHSLRDSDQVIFGVADGTTPMLMGYYNETVSKNNIHAINGIYSADRNTVNANEEAIYTLRKVLDANGDTAYIFQDELRYEEAYLVANGGKTKNKLALWTNYTSKDYGNYGVWTMTVAPGGAATIMSQGTSTGKYIQYNSADKLFGCYADPHKFTPVCLYRETTPIGTDKPAIATSIINFGEVCLSGTEVSGSKTVTVNAVRLTGDIQATLRHGKTFALSAQTLDRDGDQLTVSYRATGAGMYIDTLDLVSGDTRISVTVLLSVAPQQTIAEAVRNEDFATVYLNPVVVTKKYDRYIFVRDDSGSMLIYDGTDTNGKPFGQGLSKGDVLTGVHGRYQNYYGVPELSPVEAWTVGSTKAECLPDSNILALDSADVCRYVVLDSVVVSGEQCTYRGQTYALADKFNIGTLVENRPTRIEAIVSYDWNVLTLWIISQTVYPEPTALDNISQNCSSSPAYTPIGQPVSDDYHGIVIQRGKKTLQYKP